MNKVIVMPSNNAAWYVRLLQEKFPEAIANLISPDGWDWAGEPPFSYALDNWAWIAYKNQISWNEGKFLKLVDRAAGCRVPPLFLIVPDVVGDCRATLESWHKWYPQLKDLGWPLAFAVQDGMLDSNIPDNADLIFVGGTQEWKFKTMAHWCQKFPCHVGQVNTGKRLYEAHQAGAWSVDGTGWFRDPRSFLDLVKYLEIVWGDRIEPKEVIRVKKAICQTTKKLPRTG